MDLSIKGRAALITGASAGLGLSAAMALASEGVNVAINSRSTENLEKAAFRIREKTGADPIVIVGDLSEAAAAEKIVAAAKKALGKIDILVANAGGPPAGHFLQLTPETWEKSVHLTLFSAINLARAVISDMADAGWGRIIFITSVAVKQPIDNLIISNTYRAGVTGLAKTLSNLFARQGVTVNTVCPGYTETERLQYLAQTISAGQNIAVEDVYKSWTANIPAGRLGRPEELASLITFLSSPRAAYITGTSIPVDGGLYKGLL